MCEVFRSALRTLSRQEIWMEENSVARTLLQVLGLLPPLERARHRASSSRFRRHAGAGCLLRQGRGSIRELRS